MQTELPVSHQEARRVPLPKRSKVSVSWTDINFWLDTALLVMFTALCGCATIVRFVFPPGPAASDWRLWGADYDQWCNVQYGLLAMLAVGLLVHVMLHWSWVCNVAASRFGGDRKARVDEGTQTLYGVGLLIVLLNLVGVAVAVAALMIQRPT